MQWRRTGHIDDTATAAPSGACLQHRDPIALSVRYSVLGVFSAHSGSRRCYWSTTSHQNKAQSRVTLPPAAHDITGQTRGSEAFRADHPHCFAFDFDFDCGT